ncbi:glycosyltransferase family 4 protein [Mangrovibacterium diazotrophicum]|uniref:Glycosyltransferase involved in cell wall biosynthesis n=1 Tax=Mangrovibacterium diazotrophicum TaxID=1261403 RepID=A0A419W994_9BACT|nr:glycosyltransferase family 1 protein [Mangrovibacterium diazotrophicum]RKD91972.1 glycosyltransferase involved in cell wall biosynthesis [Mangrovibacterium diazotrophicum]
MKIAYTYQGITSHRIGGVSRYFFEIISRLQPRAEISILGKYSKNIYFEGMIDKSEFLRNLRFKGKAKLEFLIQEHNQKTRLRKHNFNIIHHTGEGLSVFKQSNNTPVIITIHDFIPEIFNYQPHRIKIREQAIKNASAIICVSENTKKDLLNFFPKIEQEKVHVIYHGFTSQSKHYSENKLGNYILYVGARTEYKNFEYFTRAIVPVLIEHDIKLVCTGQPFSSYELELIQSLEIGTRTINVGFVDDNTLNTLYYHARCFVYPSLYEGFGIPILEAFGNRCPVCISDTSCFPEIAADAACYFNPKDKNSIKQNLEKILTDDSYRQKLIEIGTERLTFFSWDKAASETLEIYKKTIENASKID